jgi:hypothetical protein
VTSTTTATVASSSGAAPTCTDGIEDGSETDVDCGGPVCSPCANGKTCLAGTDCASDFCTAGVCQPSAGDGGPTCSSCAAVFMGADPGTICTPTAGSLYMDLASCLCTGSCATACADACDTGGAPSPACQTCASGSMSGCSAQLEGCLAGVAPTCSDGLKDGAETDVDCGGVECPPCATGKVCMVDADCASGTCTAGVCH